MTTPAIQVRGRRVGDGESVYIVAEIGINHNGDLAIAKALIDAAVRARCDAVKFQKRTPDLCIPADQKHLMRDTPWGQMTYLDYRRRMEFGLRDYEEIDAYCRGRSIDWFASCWDEPSVAFLEAFDPGCYKVPSAALTSDGLLKAMTAAGRPVFLSTGMSTMEEVSHAVSLTDRGRLVLLHAVSSYPCANEDVNLRMLGTLRREFSVPVGYSGHERGLQVSLAAVALGACVLERHITLDRTMWGGDQSASIEPDGFARLVRDVRVIEQAMGDGVKRVNASELPSRKKLRHVP